MKTIESLMAAIKILDGKRVEVSHTPAIWHILMHATTYLNNQLSAVIRTELMSDGN